MLDKLFRNFILHVNNMWFEMTQCENSLINISSRISSSYMMQLWTTIICKMRPFKSPIAEIPSYTVQRLMWFEVKFSVLKFIKPLSINTIWNETLSSFIKSFTHRLTNIFTFLERREQCNENGSLRFSFLAFNTLKNIRKK